MQHANFRLGISMNDFWSKCIRIVGLPGLVLFIFYVLIDKIFDERLTNLLGINKIFILILIMLVLLGVFFIYSTFKITKPLSDKKINDNPSETSQTEVNKPDFPSTSPAIVKTQTVEYRDNARHEGDNNFS